jgi:alkylation response protein AidB-like acyl-CoA dehydrogenase
MDFHDSPDEAEFRAGLRSWLAQHVATDPRPEAERDWPERLAAHRVWAAKLYEAGYVGLNWPAAYGGHDRPLTYQAIVLEELARAGAPEHLGGIGLGMAGPTILAWGTEDHKRRFIPQMLSGEHIWCQGFSEPNAGSDLASLQTRAVRDGDHYLVSGQKVWSSFAHIADWCILLARTDATGSKHEGLTYLLLDMHAPGVEVRPLRQITGDSEFNEIFLDDVQVPADLVLGREGDGWSVAITTLMNERANLGFILSVRLDTTFREVVDLARSPRPDGVLPAEDPFLRDRIAEAWTDLQALRFTNYRAFSGLLKSGMPGPEGSVAKLFWAESNQRLTRLAVDLEGAFAQLGAVSDAAVDQGRWPTLQLRSRGNTIEGGTSEILRNIIAERVLGLPRSR